MCHRLLRVPSFCSRVLGGCALMLCLCFFTGQVACGAGGSISLVPTITLLVPEPETSQVHSFYKIIPEFLASIASNAVVLEHHPGMGGGRALHALASRRANGSQIAGVSLPTFLLQPMAGQKRFQPDSVALTVVLARADLGLWVPEKSPWRTVGQMAQHIRDSGRALFYFSGTGSWTTYEMATLFFNQASGVLVGYLPYMGTKEASQAVLNGDAIAVWGVVGPASSMPGMRLLGTASPMRSPLCPDVPTFNESGISLEVSEQYGLALPAGADEETRLVTSNLFTHLANDPLFVARAATLGYMVEAVPYPLLPELVVRQTSDLRDFMDRYIMP